MNWKLMLGILLFCFLGFMVFVNAFNFLRLNGFFEEQKNLPDYLVIVHNVYLEREPNEDYYNCWDYSNALVKELEANGYNAFVKKGLKCNSYCWRPDYNSSLCCEPHAWVAIETDNGLIELEATTGRIIWK